MSAFPPETFAFLRGLHRNNDRDWFEANRARYDAAWRAPALAFIEAVSDGMDTLDPPLRAEARLNGSLRRINRDIRFSKEKTPYAPRLHMIFWAARIRPGAPGGISCWTPMASASAQDGLRWTARF